MYIDLQGAELTRYWPYEMVWVTGIYLSIESSQDTEWHRLHKDLAFQVGHFGPDNKETYELTYEDGRTLVIQFYDGVVHLASGVRQRAPDYLYNNYDPTSWKARQAAKGRR